MTFDDMGASWATVRDAVRSGTLRATDASAAEVATRFDALLNFTALQLGRRLSAESDACGQTRSSVTSMWTRQGRACHDTRRMACQTIEERRGECSG